MTVNEEFVCRLTFSGGQTNGLIHVGEVIGGPHDVLYLGTLARRRDRSRCDGRGRKSPQRHRTIDAAFLYPEHHSLWW